jgi:UDP-N-acetylglucosamine--N-acetylmuramyl-(pentapeptide) pyrophosphoryl-undecaprenol N-acetylglucosamine transferase
VRRGRVATMTTLLVASTGGHLNELLQLAPRLEPRDDDVVWATNDSIQSRSLLAGAEVVYVPYHGSRNLPLTALTGARASSLLRRARPDRVVSTGSSIALSFMLPARALSIPCHYIESGTRVTGPSVTGRVLAKVPGVHCYTQHPVWAGGAWSYAGSVLDGFTPRAVMSPPRIDRVVVVLGSWRQPFRRLVERLVEVLPSEAEVLWQTGHTAVDDLVPDARPWVPAKELQASLREADVVITHAGMGATMDALAAGRLPVVVPRLAAHGEQIDDHQVELATELDRLGLAVVRFPQDLTLADLHTAASRRVEQSATAPGLRLSR